MEVYQLVRERIAHNHRPPGAPVHHRRAETLHDPALLCVGGHLYVTSRLLLSHIDAETTEFAHFDDDTRTDDARLCWRLERRVGTWHSSDQHLRMARGIEYHNDYIRLDVPRFAITWGFARSHGQVTLVIHEEAEDDLMDAVNIFTVAPPQEITFLVAGPDDRHAPPHALQDSFGVPYSLARCMAAGWFIFVRVAHPTTSRHMPGSAFHANDVPNPFLP